MSLHILGAPVVLRAAAVLTNAAVESTPYVLDSLSSDGRVMVYLDFTIGSLTNCIVTPKVLGPDGTYHTNTTPGALTMTATGKYAFPFDAIGSKRITFDAIGTGTVTSSSLKITVQAATKVNR